MAKIKIDDFATAVDELLAEFVQEEYGARQVALKAGAAVLVQKLEAESPTDEGEFAKSWETKEYNDAVYVHNTKTVDSKTKKNIPLTNLIEFKAGGKPFIRRTADAAQNDVYNTIKNKLNGG